MGGNLRAHALEGLEAVDGRGVEAGAGARAAAADAGAVQAEEAQQHVGGVVPPRGEQGLRSLEGGGRAVAPAPERQPKLPAGELQVQQPATAGRREALVRRRSLRAQRAVELAERRRLVRVARDADRVAEREPQEAACEALLGPAARRHLQRERRGRRGAGAVGARGPGRRDLPVGVRRDVVQRCLERLAGVLVRKLRGAARSAARRARGGCTGGASALPDQPGSEGALPRAP